MQFGMAEKENLVTSACIQCLILFVAFYLLYIIQVFRNDVKLLHQGDVLLPLITFCITKPKFNLSFIIHS